jgi:FMN phosphatase YigB (HAD superfamily)
MRAHEIRPSKLVIFDIDDTLVHTQTKVHVVQDGRVVKSLNSHDFTHYKLQPGQEFDFGAFRDAREFFNNSKPIIPMMNQLKHDIATGNKVVMVTARADFDDRELFLDTFRKYGVDMSKVHVYRAGNMTGKIQTEEKKKIIIRELLNQGKYTKAIMYDDAVPNLHSFMELKKEYPHTKFYAWHVSLEGESSEYQRTNEMKANEFIYEGWSAKYKKSINCSHPKGFSQKAHCAGKSKHNESIEMEMVCEDCGMCQTHGNLNEIAKGAKDSNGFTKCWPGKHAEGTKKGKNGGQVRNCVPNESVAEGGEGKHNNATTGFKALAKKAGGGEKGAKIAGAQFQKMKKAGQLEEDWNKVNHHDKTNGLSQKAVNSYRREHPGSKLQTAVTTKPSKLKPGSKAAKRRKSFCARMGGNKGPMKKPNGKPTPKALALRRWNCESIEEMQQLIILGEQHIKKIKEAGSPAQQAAIAINMKKNHKKPKK